MSSGFALAILIAASPATLPPVDQCAGDPSFVAFREQLAQAAERKDAQFILESLDHNVLVDLGGGQGSADFVRTWRLQAPGESPLWKELGTILRLGCALINEVREMPSIAEQMDPNRDAYEILIALDKSVLRAAPSEDSPVVAQLNWDILELGDEVRDDDWLPASLGGRSGYVRRDQVRSPLDYRMTIERVEGKWKITTFVAGD